MIMQRISDPLRFLNNGCYHASKFPKPPPVLAFFLDGSSHASTAVRLSSSVPVVFCRRAALRYLPTPSLVETVPSPRMRLPVHVVLSSSVPPLRCTSAFSASIFSCLLFSFKNSSNGSTYTTTFFMTILCLGWSVSFVGSSFFFVCSF